MKLKLKIDKKTVQDFLLQNVEKIVLGVFVLIFLLMLYSSLTSAARFDKSPEQLQADSAKARREIEATTIEGFTEALEAAAPAETAPTADGAAPTRRGLAVADYVKEAKRIRVNIEETPYTNANRWDPPIFEKRPRREAPPVLTVQELRARAGMGAFRIVEAAKAARPAARRAARDAPGMEMTTPVGGGERIRGQRWIVLTGLVPIEKQELAYAETFKLADGYDPQNDYPTYLGYWVERIEVGKATDVTNADWSKAATFISSKAIGAALEQWSTAKETEIVAPEYLIEQLVFPLGPLVNRFWDENVAHDPEIPLGRSDRQGGGSGGMRGLAPGGGRTGGMPGGLGAMPGGLGAMPGGLGAMPRMGIDRARGGRMPGGMGGERAVATEGTPFGMEEGEANVKAAEAEQAREEVQSRGEPAYKLFRFFDFNVKPGKRYAYRVRLALQNPNYGVKTSYLAKADLATKRLLETKWSEPTPPTSVLRDTQVLLVSVKPGRNSDPSGELLMTAWNQSKGVEVFKQFSITRGDVANYGEESGKVVGGHVGQATETREMMLGPLGGRGAGPLEAMMGRGPEKPAKPVKPAPAVATVGGGTKGNFDSGAIAVDLRGGERLAASGGRRSDVLESVGELLLLDPDGNLVVHNELDDLPTYEQITTSASQDRPAGPIGLGMPGTPGMGLPGGGLEGLGQPDKSRRGRGRP
jgi:hypothetical protein